MPPIPKPRKRVKNPELLAEMANSQCQITKISPWGPATQVEVHHLTKHPRHDERGNLFPLLAALHREYEQGTRRRAVGALIRAFMTQEQLDYVIGEKGEGWLDRQYPVV